MRTINYKVSYEKMISRLPALFAFLEIDEQNTCEIVSAINGKQGNYGKIVANIKIPRSFKYAYKDNGEEKTVDFTFDEDFDYTCSDNTHLIIKAGKEYAYRTIIDTYYKALSDKRWTKTRDSGLYDEPFLAFVEIGIGKKYVGLTQETNGKTKCGVPQTDKFPLAPDYIYLGEAQTLLDKMVKMKKQLDFYKKHVKFCVGDKKYYSHLKTEYELTNGDKLIEKLYELIEEAKTVAETYLGYTKDTNMALDFNVNLINTIKDLGMVTPYIQEWVEGKRYYEGDVVYYVDDNGYGMTWECVFENGGLDNIVKLDSIVKTDDYGRRYTEGEYDEETEVIAFDNESVNVGTEDSPIYKRNWKPQSLNWVKRNERWICPKCGKVYEVNKNECNCGYEGEFRHSKYVPNLPNTISVSGQCNSHLTSLRRFETYMNRDESAEYPDQYTDWLWYYRKGRIMNREAKYDEMGNIGVMYDEDNDGDTLYGKGVEAITNDNSTIGDNLKYDSNGNIINLSAWGDAITNITAVNDEDGGQGTITFEYIVGAHLKATKGQLIQVNDDFTINGTSYKKGYEIPYKIYIDNKLSNSVTFKVSKPFTYGGKKHNVDETISMDDYLTLSIVEYEVITDFTIGSKAFYVGDTLTVSDYNNLTDEYKSKCQCNKDKVKFTFKQSYHKNKEQYTKGKEVVQEDYDNFSVSDQNKCEIIVTKDFDIKTYVTDANGKKKTEYLEYTVGEKIAYKLYSKLSDENKQRIKIVATETINVASYYNVGDTISKSEYDTLPISAQKDQNLLTITVTETFFNGGTKYDVDTEIDLDTFTKMVDSDTGYLNYITIIAKEPITISNSGETARTFEKGEYIDTATYSSLPTDYQKKCTISDSQWYSIDDDGNYKYYFSNFEIDTDSNYGKNMGVKYTESYIYYKGDMSMTVTETFTSTNDNITYYEGSVLTEDEYNKLSDSDKKKCKRSEESIWSLVEDGLFEKYINGEYDKDYIPTGTDESQDYYKLYDKMTFYYDVHSYKFRIGSQIKEVPYILTDFTTNVDITHVDIEERPLIRYDYYNGVSFQPSTNTDDVYIERGVTQAFEKHIKLGEIKTFEDFENYSNGGFFQISKEDIDLG